MSGPEAPGVAEVAGAAPVLPSPADQASWEYRRPPILGPVSRARPVGVVPAGSRDAGRPSACPVRRPDRDSMSAAPASTDADASAAVSSVAARRSGLRYRGRAVFPRT
ncbi:MAG TPA: hypothetical protein VF060_04660 [Trebonia sp.]